MGGIADLPQPVVRLIQSVVNAEFATMTADGVPIDTPLFAFPAEDLSTIDMATGLAYPAKANRVRRNPKVGVLIEGVLPGEPTISIAGMAAVRDADIQGNALRYLAETGHYAHLEADLWPEQQKAIWYWMRIIMVIAPKQILWWDDPAALESAPHRWDAPADTEFPVSDPLPPTSPQPAPKWSQPPWTQLAQGTLR
ncbi:MAG: hemerythrin cation binding domain protein [Mucilaginibacter sp.]|nr:hemerythrin cation binding domain protein [Mucilaginibacter sp.]